MIVGLKRTASQGCMIFTVLIVALYIIGFLIDRSGNWIPSFNTVWIVLGVSFAAAAAERILDGGEATPIKIILNFAVCLAGYILVFVIGGGYSENGSAVLISLLVFAAVYIIANLVRYTVIGIRRRHDSEGEDYTPAFKKDRL